jgi:hypothetical protein
MIFGGFTVFIETLRVIRAKPIEPLAVSCVSSKAPAEWSVSVTTDDVGRSEAPRARNAGRNFREGGR